MGRTDFACGVILQMVNWTASPQFQLALAAMRFSQLYPNVKTGWKLASRMKARETHGGISRMLLEYPLWQFWMATREAKEHNGSETL
jgi:hypothetical protein